MTLKIGFLFSFRRKFAQRHYEVLLVSEYIWCINWEHSLVIKEKYYSKRNFHLPFTRLDRRKLRGTSVRMACAWILGTRESLWPDVFWRGCISSCRIPRLHYLPHDNDKYREYCKMSAQFVTPAYRAHCSKTVPFTTCKSGSKNRCRLVWCHQVVGSNRTNFLFLNRCYTCVH
jgi:hypothetical protein